MQIELRRAQGPRSPPELTASIGSRVEPADPPGSRDVRRFMIPTGVSAACAYSKQYAAGTPCRLKELWRRLCAGGIAPPCLCCSAHRDGRDDRLRLAEQSDELVTLGVADAPLRSPSPAPMAHVFACGLWRKDLCRAHHRRRGLSDHQRLGQTTWRRAARTPGHWQPVASAPLPSRGRCKIASPRRSAFSSTS